MATYMDDLDNKGYCIINNILTTDKCNNYISKIWDWLESLKTNINRDIPSTWNHKKWPENYRGIIKHYGIGHEQFVWDIRCEKKIIDVFTNVWNTSDLFVSFDAICVMKPPEISGKFTKTHWIHTDQSFLNSERISIQGLVNLEETSQEDSTFTLYENSHKYHKEFGTHFNIKQQSNWYKLQKEEVQWLNDKGLTQIRLDIPKGSILLWDSRLFHANCCAIKGRTNPRFRYVIYVSMSPKSFSTNIDIKKRQKAFKEQRLTTHWTKQVQLVPKNPRTYGNSDRNHIIAPFNKPNVSNKSLI